MASERMSRSRATSWVTLATDDRGRPVSRSDSATLPGLADHLRFLVSGTHTTVRMALRLKSSDCTTTTGRRYPGPEPCGSPRSAQHTSPWAITTRSTGGTQPQLRGRTHPGSRRPRAPQARNRSMRSARLASAGRRTRAALSCKPRFASDPRAWQVARPSRTRHSARTRQSSYPEYNRERWPQAGSCQPSLTWRLAPVALRTRGRTPSRAPPARIGMPPRTGPPTRGHPRAMAPR